MEKGLCDREVTTSLTRVEIHGGIDAGLRSLALLQRSRRVRRMVDWAIRGIEVEPIPPSLDERQTAILVSNYPSVPQTLRAIMKVGCRLPGQQFRLRGIGRSEVIIGANLLLKALGIDKLIFPAWKDETGAYRLQRVVFEEVMAYLDTPGHVLWLSITGRTMGNGLLEEDLRTGAAVFSVKKGVPIVPMGLVTAEHNGAPKVVKARFGEPLPLFPAEEIGDLRSSEFLSDYTKYALCEVARMLPPGQRGDFENVDEKLDQTMRRLRMHGLGDHRRDNVPGAVHRVRGEQDE